MKSICDEWRITEEEYEVLNKEFGDLCEFAAWELYRNNVKNNHTDEQTDISQELRIALLKAGCYYKRQNYIEYCLNTCKKFAFEQEDIEKIEKIEDIWIKRKDKGENKKKFTNKNEQELFSLADKLIPKDIIMDRNSELKIDLLFRNYCKAIIWNAQKTLGKKITREKSVRNSQVSLSEFDTFALENLSFK